MNFQEYIKESKAEPAITKDFVKTVAKEAGVPEEVAVIWINVMGIADDSEEGMEISKDSFVEQLEQSYDENIELFIDSLIGHSGLRVKDLMKV